MNAAASPARSLVDVGASAAEAVVARPGASTSAAPTARVVTARASSPERVVDIGSLSERFVTKGPEPPGARRTRAPSRVPRRCVWSRSHLPGIPTCRDVASRPTAAGQCRTWTGFPRQVRVGAALAGDAATLLPGALGRNRRPPAVIIVTTGVRAVISGEPPEERDAGRGLLTRTGRRGHVTTWCKSGRPAGRQARWYRGGAPPASGRMPWSRRPRPGQRADDPPGAAPHDVPEGVHDR